jgi:hypothetical protein
MAKHAVKGVNKLTPWSVNSGFDTRPDVSQGLSCKRLSKGGTKLDKICQSTWFDAFALGQWSEP